MTNTAMKINITGMPKRVEKALKAVIVARAAWQTVDEIDKATHTEVLRENVFTEEESGERITDSRDDFMMSESNFMHYCELVYARNCEKGLDSGSAELNFWPIHKAVYDAEDAYIDAIAADIPEYTPDIVKTLKNSPKYREQVFSIIGL